MSAPPPPPPPQHSPLRHSLHDIGAGTVGGLCTVLVGHPLDTIKVRLQVQTTHKLSMASCIALTLKEEGWRGFYKGMQSPLAGEGFFNAAQFLAYGATKRAILDYRQGQELLLRAPGGAAVPLGERRTDLTVAEYFVAGAITGFISTFIEAPIDLFKSQLQTQIFLDKPRFTTFPGALAYVWRVGGVRGIYQGLGATFIRTTPASASYFGVYELAKTLQLKPGQSKKDLSPLALLTAGGLGGVSYWLSSFPMDTIKSSMQTDAVERSARKYSSVVDCARQLYAEGGVRRFYLGLTPCLIRSFPANAVCFFCYEKTLHWLEKL